MVHQGRVRQISKRAAPEGVGPVVYWMSRDQRVRDNWAFLYACERARALNVPVVVVFCLRKKFAYATERVVDFMLCGLAEVEKDLATKRVPFYFLLGDQQAELVKFARTHKVSVLVSDFSPLRHHRAWQKRVADKLGVPLYEVDAHNIVPAWVASQKQEFGAYTLRPKLHKLLSEYLEEFPRAVLPPAQKSVDMPHEIHWASLRSRIASNKAVQPLRWIMPGEGAAHKALAHFLLTKLRAYDTDRNDPTQDGQSHLSPYLHFGQISAQRVVLDLLASHWLRIQDVLDKAKNGAAGARGNAAAFVEELVVRRELSDNYCLYNAHYDSPKGYPAWAQKTLQEHAHDKREYVYSLAEFEHGRTHDELWNAAQAEMIQRGKMHGYMRMYWAKKILEWTRSVTEAHRIAVHLNDTYSLDGRDPNGYAGIAWSMGGVHDRAWFERPIFGKIRYMSYGGAKNKFSIKRYVNAVARGGEHD